jgi:hypothetical protein
MTEIGVWHVTQQGPLKLSAGRLNLEKELEEWIEKDPDLLETGLKIIGRQIRLEGGRLDLLGLDLQGNFVVIEIKKGEVTRGAVSQAIDYGSSIKSMPFDDLAERVTDYLKNDRLLNALLDERGGISGDKGKPRNVRLFIVGTGKQQGLERMVDFLASFKMPISVVSFQVFDVGAGQRMLIRELTDTEVERPEPHKSKHEVEKLLALADQHGIGGSFRALRDAAERYDLYPRPYATSIMYTPPSNRARMLFTAWVKPKAPGRVRVYVGTDVFPEFYPVSLLDAHTNLGDHGWRDMTNADVNKFVVGLDRLFSKILPEE